MTLPIASIDQYDANICYMEWIDFNDFWVQPASSCTPSKQCTWNLAQGRNPLFAPLSIPSNVTTFQYTCDNQPHDLGFSNDGAYPNRYVCTCGQSIGPPYVNDTALQSGCATRCDRPWTAAFDKVCNVVSQTTNLKLAKANYTSGLLSQGACVSVAGQGKANMTFSDSKYVSVDAPSIIDGFGIAQACDNQEFDSTSRICNCNGALPETAWGRKIQNRDPCGLSDHHSSKAWIAAPVVGGIALLVCLGAAAFFLKIRKSRRSRIQEDTPLATLSSDRHNAANHREERQATLRPNAGFDPSTPSQTSIESENSDRALVDTDIHQQKHELPSRIV